MRCFIAIDMEPAVKAALTELQKKLSGQVRLGPGDVTWVRPEGMHLTLKFLGETPDPLVADVCGATEEVCKGYPPFDLEIRGAGHFGGKGARVLWVGIAGATDSIVCLQKDLEEKLELLGFPKEDRPFSPHLTICRIKNPKAGFDLANAIDAHKAFEAGTTGVETVIVYQSDLTPRGPIHTALGRYNLKSLGKPQ